MKVHRIPFHEAFLMLSKYAWTRIREQIKSLAFIIIYLIVFQILILNVPLANALLTAGGIFLVVFGLSFFLEGLILGLMPLGERVGTKMPQRVGIIIIAVFGLILGFGATFAEPAISALRTAGSTINAWEAPLLYMILEPYAGWLIISVGIGVGVAVALGMFRFYYSWSIKPFIYIIIPAILLLSVFAWDDDNLKNIVGLAWDCGAVTTGAVTVPLVLALGIGVSRASGKGKGSSGGFGIILLASAFPVLAVLTLGIVLNSRAPSPVDEKTFFSVENRGNALKVFENEEKLRFHEYTHGSESITITIPEEISVGKVLKEESAGGLRAVIPLSVILLLVLILLREKIRFKDEVALGILFTLLGMILLTSGIRLGLASLGSEVGSELPRAFAKEDKYIDRIVINNFDASLLFKAISADGTVRSYFNMVNGDDVKRIEFQNEKFNPVTLQYEYVITQEPLFGKKLTVLGLILVMIFAFGLGYGATLAEPALNALGLTVEGLTVGAIRQKQLVRIVSVGVGIGITLGFARILFDIPLIWLLVPSYILLIILSIWSKEDFTAISWDSGGVTTGPVTVPLVLAMGLSIGGALKISDGFGILALASAFPIITTLTFGLYTSTKQRRSIDHNQKSEKDE